ncbi:MAG: META domain-containing protein [Candidatus Latescibacteria bacterium]|jgi:heat shock protein HslJ|nr:META domain-containing protein [Candidatus Latescibacterota bacterium]
MKTFHHVLCGALALLGMSCGREDPVSGSFGSVRDLAGGTWTLQYFARERLRGPLDGTEITLEFRMDDVPVLVGRAGCNQYGARFTAVENRIGVEPIMSTEMLCTNPNGTMEQEAWYLSQLAQARGFSVRDDRLALLDETGAPLLVFVRR